MTYQPQHITAPDGTRLVVITEADYIRLREQSEDAADIAASEAALARHAQDGAAIPSEVMGLMLDGNAPVRAWRLHRGLTQTELAASAGLSQSAINAIELKPERVARPANLRAIAKALDVPVRALSLDD